MRIDNIVIHALDTYPDMDVGVEWVRNIHVNENGWSDVGYHYLIPRNGILQFGRRNEGDNYIAGAHVLGLNANSLGIAMAGGLARKGGHPSCNFNFAQYRCLESLYFQLSAEWPNAKWSGHYQHDRGKSCPTFDVEALLGLV